MSHTKSNGAGARNSKQRQQLQRRKELRLRFIERHLKPFRRYYQDMTLTPQDVYLLMHNDD